MYVVGKTAGAQWTEIGNFIGIQKKRIKCLTLCRILSLIGLDPMETRVCHKEEQRLLSSHNKKIWLTFISSLSLDSAVWPRLWDYFECSSVSSSTDADWHLWFIIKASDFTIAIFIEFFHYLMRHFWVHIKSLLVDSDLCPFWLRFWISAHCEGGSGGGGSLGATWVKRAVLWNNPSCGWQCCHGRGS